MTPSRRPHHDDQQTALRNTLRRRRFLGVAADASAVALLGPGSAPAHATPARHPHYVHHRPVIPPGHLGIQLHTLRDQTSSLGFARVFEELARYGYEEVEFAGYTQGTVGPVTLPRLRRLLGDHGLRGIGSHVGHASADPTAYPSPPP